MAQDQGTAASAPVWTKLFTAFKIALDMKKLVLAAAGIFFTFLGLWVFGWTFYSMRSLPDWQKDYEPKEEKGMEERKAAWLRFKAKRDSWNLLHELAGSPTDREKRVDAADATDRFDVFLLLHQWERAYRRLSEPIQVKDKAIEVVTEKGKILVTYAGDDKEADAALQKLKTKELALRHLTITEREEKDGDKVAKIVLVDGVKFRTDPTSFETLKEYREGALTTEQVAARSTEVQDRTLGKVALQAFNTHLVHPKVKPAGLLRGCPWTEYRGQNPYLLVSDTIKTRGESLFGGGRFFVWLFREEAPVVLEPLYKFLAPVVYFFDARAGGWDRLYLIFVTLWTLTIWGFFGGAICRIAAVQVARNERITLAEAIAFTKERCVSYLAAPVFPMVLVGIFVLVLMVLGWLIWIPWLGEVIAGLSWIVVLLLGFTMAIVLVGLVGWPLMTATISTEGTDSFDALSRSYSYVYQAPWQYLWYNFLAVIYGAVLVFFIGFMASLMVFLGKWGVSTAVGPADATNPARDREPSYLFYYAPTSFGWRDLLISSSAYAETKTEIDPEGREIKHREFKPEYEKEISGANKFGSILVCLWIYPLFLMVVAFGYSYFWSVSTIIYFLMRHCVDDTEMDEVHQEDEDFEDPFLKPAPSAAAAPAAGKPGTVSLNVVEPPPPPSPATSYTADVPPAPTPPPENPPPSTP